MCGVGAGRGGRWGNEHGGTESHSLPLERNEVLNSALRKRLGMGMLRSVKPALRAGLGRYLSLPFIPIVILSKSLYFSKNQFS